MLQSEEVPATGFVIGASIDGGAAQNMEDLSLSPLSGRQLREMSEKGVEIGSHTFCHAELTTLPSDRVREELTESRARIEEVCGSPVSSFCYPRGRFSPRILGCLQESGYSSACTTLRGTCQDADRPFELYRIRASMDRRGLRLYYALTRFYDWLNRRRRIEDRIRIFGEDRFPE